MKEQNFTMTDRKKLLTEICKKYNISIGTYSNITVNRFMMCINPYQICFCPNAKTGTTTWMQRIMVIYIHNLTRLDLTQLDSTLLNLTQLTNITIYVLEL